MKAANKIVRHQASRITKTPRGDKRLLATSPFTVAEYIAQAITKIVSLPKSRVLQVLRLSILPDDFNTVDIENGVERLDNIIAKLPDERDHWCKQVSDDLLQGLSTYVNPEQIHAYTVAGQLQHNLDIKVTGLKPIEETVTYFRKDIRDCKIQFVNGRDLKHVQLLLGVKQSEWFIQGYTLLQDGTPEWKRYNDTVSKYTYSLFRLDATSFAVELLTRKLKVKTGGDLLRAAFDVRESSLVSVN